MAILVFRVSRVNPLAQVAEKFAEWTLLLMCTYICIWPITVCAFRTQLFSNMYSFKFGFEFE
jgi:uncharacterized membrane protein YhdT